MTDLNLPIKELKEHELIKYIIHNRLHIDISNEGIYSNRGCVLNLTHLTELGYYLIKKESDEPQRIKLAEKESNEDLIDIPELEFYWTKSNGDNLRKIILASTKTDIRTIPKNFMERKCMSKRKKLEVNKKARGKDYGCFELSKQPISLIIKVGYHHNGSNIELEPIYKE